MQKFIALITIDVVIPSFRLNPATLLPILKLPKPAGVQIKFYLIADNPSITPHPSILELIDNENYFLIINPVNKGASITRNIGIESGQGSWILFLDDDIDVLPNLLSVYADAVQLYPTEIGFIGMVTLPNINTPFARAVDANGLLSMFSIAKTEQSYSWGVTANFMISREAVGNVRFADVYPKTGGGEDVEFFIRVREQHNFKNYKSLPEANVTHPWWNEGKSDFMRFYRYGLGNSFLPPRNKAYRWYDLLNTSETLLVCCIALVVTLCTAILYFMLATLVIEYVISVLRVQRGIKKINFMLSGYVALLRNVYEAGILVGNISRGRVQGIGERFNYEGRVNNSNFRLNRFKIIKLVLYAITIAVIAHYN